MNKIICTLLTAILVSIASVNAQTVNGTITDTNGSQLSFVNIVELSQVDSSFQKGTVSKDDGSFSIDDVKKGNLLRFSSLGYQTQYMTYNGQISLNITMKESTEMLGEVIVKSHLPKVTFNGEGMTTIIAGSILEKTSNMEQLLSRIPSVSAHNGEIEVFGRGTPEIYINGRKMRDNMELERLQPNEIKRLKSSTIQERVTMQV